MNAVVLIPWGGGDPVRARNLERVLDHLDRGNFQHRLGVYDRQPFSRGRAINRGLAVSTEEVVFLNDADTICPHDQIRQAVELAREEPGLVFAFDEYVRLDESGTEPIWRMPLAPSNGAAAIRRDCLEQLGGYDPRFQAWGYEDLSFNFVCEAHWPMRRLPGTVFHLAHPPAERDPAWEELERANLRLYERYADRAGDRRALLELRSEAGELSYA